MNKPKFITFTGADDSTDVERIVELSRRYPIEIGYLISATNKRNRYAHEFLLDDVMYLAENGVNIAFHLCGRIVDDYVYGAKTDIFFYPILPAVKRIQLNIKRDIGSLYILNENAKLNFVDIILQHREGNFPPQYSNIYYLFDCSGGRGIVPETYINHPGKGRFVGYAGGISDKNVKKILNVLPVKNDQEYWIDMETGVRTDDWFDLDKIEKVCKIVYD